MEKNTKLDTIIESELNTITEPELDKTIETNTKIEINTEIETNPETETNTEVKAGTIIESETEPTQEKPVLTQESQEKPKSKTNLKLQENVKEKAEYLANMAEKLIQFDPSLDLNEALTIAMLSFAKSKKKAIDTRRNKSMEVSREKLRKLVQVRYDYQDLRIRTSNRLAKKADGTDQNKDDAILPEDEIPQISKVLETSREMEDDIENSIKTEVQKFPIYREFLSKVKGCGPSLSAIIISTIDIYKADNAAKIIQYAGLNPGLIHGKKKDADGNIIVTEDLVRGDKPTKGYLLPYNAFLKTKIMGVLAPCMIKANSQYRIYYDNMKQRLSNSELPVNGNPDKKWKDESKAHINMASLRYMEKMFLQDLYGVWRKLEGLPARKPYQEEYLGHVSTMPSVADQILREEI